MRYFFTWMCFAAILVLSLMPVQEMHLENTNLSDKWAHFLMYGGLSSVVWVESVWRNRKPSYGRLVLTTLLLPVLLGVAMEFAQAYLTTYRSGDVMDAVANSLGSLIAFAAGNLYLLKKKLF